MNLHMISTNCLKVTVQGLFKNLLKILHPQDNVIKLFAHSAASFSELLRFILG